jgi:hypothetical protein
VKPPATGRVHRYDVARLAGGEWYCRTSIMRIASREVAETVPGMVTVSQAQPIQHVQVTAIPHILRSGVENDTWGMHVLWGLVRPSAAPGEVGQQQREGRDHD